MPASQIPVVNELAQKAHRLARELGDAIDAIRPYGVKVNAEVGIHDGSEGVTLSDLNGEVELTIYRIVEIPEENEEEE